MTLFLKLMLFNMTQKHHQQNLKETNGLYKNEASALQGK